MNKDYFIKSVKRRKEAICKNCGELIDIGEQADIVTGYEFLSGMPNVIGVTHSKCTNEFIIDNSKKTDLWHS